MKSTILALIILLSSCTSRKFMFKESEIISKGYSIDKWDVIQNNKVIGHLNSMEWELYNNKLVREISVITTHQLTDNEMIDIIKFLHTKYPTFKIEVNNDSTLFFK